jgi:hypothetical protein
MHRSPVLLVLRVSGSLSAHHQEYLVVHRHWYILCSCDDRLLPGVGWNCSLQLQDLTWTLLSNKIIQLPQDCAIVQVFRCRLVTTVPQITINFNLYEMCRARIGTGAGFPQRFFGSHLQTLIPPLLHANVSLCRSVDQTPHFYILMPFKVKISTLTSIGLLTE